MIDLSKPIAVIAPCGAHNIERFEAGVTIATERGAQLDIPDDLLQPHRYLAAPDDVRRRHLVEAFTNPAIGAVWLARGGYGLTRILDGLPTDTFLPTPVIGFSDATALFNRLHLDGLGPVVHGPVLHSLSNTDDASIDALFATMRGERRTLPATEWVSGSVEAPIVGGNLCLLAATCGTLHQLSADGHILVLEEVGEPAYRVDRMLQQCISAGVLDGVRGVVLGEFVDCRVPEGASYTLEDMLREHLAPLGVPVFADAPIGHGARNHAFVWGETALLANGSISLLG